MGRFETFSDAPDQPKKESLHIAKSAKKIKCRILAFTFKDKNTQQIVIYVPSFEISGYGETLEKAEEMVKQSLDSYFEYLIHLPPKSIEAELKKYGWLHDKYKNKDYSKSYVDGYGNLQDFALEGDVKMGVLTY